MNNKYFYKSNCMNINTHIFVNNYILNNAYQRIW